MVWLRDPQKIEAGTTAVMGLNSSGTSVISSLSRAIIVNGLFLVIASGTSIALEETTLKLNGTIRFEGPARPEMQPVSEGSISFDGPTRGNIGFMAFVQALSLRDTWHWGFQFFYPGQDDGTYTGEFLALAAGGASDFPQFTVSLSPSDPTNAVVANLSTMTFTGQTLRGADLVPTVLDAAYRTTFGEALALVPTPGPYSAANPNAARFAFNNGPVETSGQERFHISPAGDFILQIG